MADNSFTGRSQRAMSRVSGALQEVQIEAFRAHRLASEGVFSNTPATMPFMDGAVKLGEEYGEVCRALVRYMIDGIEPGSLGRVREELIQVAAVAVNMIAGIDAQSIPDVHGR